jgi:uncharacterized membrane protein
MAILIMSQVCAALTVFVALALSPTLSPRKLFFAVRVSPEFAATPAARRLLQRFRWHLAVQAAASTALCVALAPRAWPWVVGTLLQLIGGTFAYRGARRQVLPHAVRAAPPVLRSMEIEAARERMPGGPLAQLLPLVILLASGAWIALAWERLPERFPIHWSAGGVPNHWVDKEPVAVYAMPAYGIAILGMLWFTGWLTLHFARRGVTSAERGVKRTTLNVLLWSEYLVALTFSLISVAPLFGESAQRSLMLSLILLSPISLIGLVAVLVVSSRRTAEAGSANVEPGTSAAPSAGSADDCDAHWKGGGIIYDNPDDPALLVPKRFGLGYTFNFAHAAAYWAIGLVLAVPLLGVLLLRVALH